jgi:hypothetical protein
MQSRRLFTELLIVISLIFLARTKAQDNSAVPRMWDDAAMEDLEAPLSHATFSPKHLSAKYYYQTPVRPIFRSYPVYAPMKEPPGYFESLLQKEPQEFHIDRNQVRNDSDWIRFGEIVFQAAMTYDCCVVKLEDVGTAVHFSIVAASRH